MKVNRFYVYTFLNHFLLLIPFTALFLGMYKGLTNDQITIYLSMYAFSVFLMEIPTGILADRIGEKKSLIIGNVFSFLSFLVLLVAREYSAILARQFIRALGVALCSGATSSLLYKYVKEQSGSEDEYKKVVSKFDFFSWIGLASAFISGYFIVSANIIYILWGSMIASALSIIVCIFLPAVRTQNITPHSSVKRLLRSIRKELSKNRELLNVLIVTSSLMSIIVSAYLLFQPYMNEMNLSGPWNGIVYFFLAVSASLGSRLFPNLMKRFRNREVVMIPSVCLCLIVIFVLIGLTSNYAVLIWFLLFRFVWGYLESYTAFETNRHIKTDSARSTILSGQSLLTSLLQGSLLFFLGIISIPVQREYLIIAFLFMPVLLVSAIHYISPAYSRE